MSMQANRIAKVAVACLVLVSFVQATSAIVAVEWMGLQGFYKSDGATALLAGAGTQTALAQLIYSSDLVYDPVDSGATHYLSGTDQWLADYQIDAGTSLYGEFTASPVFTQAFTVGYLYVRVFDQGSMSGISNGMWYYDSPFTNTLDNTGYPVSAADPFNISAMTVAFGDTLNLQVVPEPSTWAFLALGLAALAGRKFRRG